MPLIDPVEERAVALATEVVETFAPRFLHHWQAGMRRKLGLFNEEAEDKALIESLLTWMHQTKADFTNTFADLTETLPGDGACAAEETFLRWHERWRARLQRQPQSPAEAEQLRRENNPAFIPRNHRVEAALTAAEQGDMGVMERLLAVLHSPYDHTRAAPEHRQPAPDSGVGYRTFCGT